MTVLVVTTAAGTLASFGEREVRRVDSLAAVREECEAAAVVVVESLADATPDEALGAVRAGAPGTPVVRLGASDDPGAYDHVVAADAPSSLRTTVRVAARAADYRQAVDDLYEQCLARATCQGDARAFYEALARARRRFEAVRHEAGETPYGSLLGPHAPEPADVAAFREALGVEEE